MGSLEKKLGNVGQLDITEKYRLYTECIQVVPIYMCRHAVFDCM